MAIEQKSISTTTNPQLTNWSINGTGRNKSLYRLAVIPSFSDMTLPGTGINDEWEYNFSVAPQGLDQDETIAVTITPSQDGGQFIEHQGSLYKTIVIAGTTGLRPNRPSGSDIFTTSSIIDRNTGLPIGEKSGFELITDLRNFFRNYFDIKRDPDRAASLMMVWQNVYEADFFVVEPIVFRTRRSSESPVTCNYEIQLRTIRPIDAYLFEVQRDTRKIRQASATMPAELRTDGVRLAKALSVLNSVGGFIASNAQVVNSAAASFGQGVQSVLTSVMSGATALSNAIVTFSGTANSILNIPRSTVMQLANNAFAAFHAIENTKAKFKETFSSAGWSWASTLFYDLQQHAYKMIGRVATRVYTRDELFTRKQSFFFEKATKAYKDQERGNTPPKTGGSKTYIGNSAVPAGTAISVVGNQDTIYSLAQRLLGDQSRWKELTVLNQLKSPYVAANGDGAAILRPGDNILYPAKTGKDVINVVPDISSSASALTNRLGRDLKLVTTQALGGLSTYDLAVNTKGDLDFVEGLPNLEQAINIKFSTERGSLPTHPNFGIATVIGSKAVLRSMIELEVNARACLLADSRIAKVGALRFSLDGNVLSCRADLQVVDTNESISVGYSAR